MAMDNSTDQKFAALEQRARERDAKDRKDTEEANYGCPAGRVHDLVAYFHFLHGETLPDDEEGRKAFWVLGHHLVRLRGDWMGHLRRYAHRGCPWLTAEEFESVVQDIFAKPMRWRADTLGKLIELPYETRQLLGITSIGSCDVSKEGRERMRRERWNDKRKVERKPRKTRGEYEGNSLAKTKPWKAEGISERTWHYRRAKGRVTK